MAKKALSIVANCGHAQLTKALRVEETKQKQIKPYATGKKDQKPQTCIHKDKEESKRWR